MGPVVQPDGGAKGPHAGIGYTIAPAITQADLSAVAALFGDYAASLPVDLTYQDFDDELNGLPGKYAPPAGLLLLARDAQGVPAGCVGLRELSPDCCEMKRLFICPPARGKGLGRLLTLAVISHARDNGYTELRLDTLPSMTDAIALYGQLGFVPIPAYYGPTPSGTVFLSLQL